ncbi:MAG: aminotransferase class IV [Candidatus Dadabacteria bacterium]
MAYICFRGEYIQEGKPVLTIANRSYKYGDGLFETMKLIDGQIPLADLHFERLFLSLKMLEIKVPAELSSDELLRHINQLCQLNSCHSGARIRLSVYRNDANEGEYAIEATPLDLAVNSWNEEGLIVDLYPYARKSSDAFANLKTANFLPYVLAARYAEQKKVDDCIVLNAMNKIADTTKANLFLLRNVQLFTPALHQGCINGVMRRFLIENLKAEEYEIHQAELSEEDLLSADEVFLTNAVFNIRWVKQYKNKTFGSKISREIYDEVQRILDALKS